MRGKFILTILLLLGILMASTAIVLGQNTPAPLSIARGGHYQIEIQRPESGKAGSEGGRYHLQSLPSTLLLLPYAAESVTACLYLPGIKYNNK